MVWWRLIVDEFAPKEIRHIAVEDNAVADFLSRMKIVGGLVVSRFAPNGAGVGFDSYTS